LSFFARLWSSRRIAGVRRDDAAKLAIPPDRAITHGPEIDIKYVDAYVPPTMRAFGIVVAHPDPMDVVQLGRAEADEETQAFALDCVVERSRECVCI